MIAAEIRRILDRLDREPADALESETLEIKSWDTAPAARRAQIRELRETVVCLANARGGIVLLGVADRQRGRRQAIRGVGDLEVAALRRDVYDGTDPHILVDIEELTEPEGRLLVIRVPRGLPPHTTTEGVAKIRVGKECKPLTGSDLARVWSQAGERDLTSEPAVGATVGDLDPDQIRALQTHLAASGGKPELNRLPPEEVLRNVGLVRDGSVTLAALLLIGRPDAIARWMPQHEVIFMRLRGRSEYDVRHDLRGPILGVLETLQRVLEAHLKIELLKGEGFSEASIPDISWSTAREAVLNAVTHRDYFQQKSVHVTLQPDRLVVSSPGGFPGGVTPANILRHAPARRNPLLAGVLQSAGFVNRAGLGVDRMYEDLLRLGKGFPRYEADESHVSLTLPLVTHAPFARFVARETREGRLLDLDDLIVLRSAADLGRIDRKLAAERLQIQPEEATARLVSLRERDYLKPRGRGPWTAYGLAGSLSTMVREESPIGPSLLEDHEAVSARVLRALLKRGKLTNADVREMTGLSRAEAQRLMTSLILDGAARLQGRGRGAHYVPSRRRGVKPKIAKNNAKK